MGFFRNFFCYKDLREREYHYAVLKSLRRIEQKLNIIEVHQMGNAADILTKVTEQTTIIESVRTLVEQLKAAASDPAELQAIVNALDSNNAALAVLAGTPEQPA